jgi:hypothetical protein
MLWMSCNIIAISAFLSKVDIMPEKDKAIPTTPYVPNPNYKCNSSEYQLEDVVVNEIAS